MPLKRNPPPQTGAKLPPRGSGGLEGDDDLGDAQGVPHRSGDGLVLVGRQRVGRVELEDGRDRAGEGVGACLERSERGGIGIEAGIDRDTAMDLALLGEKVRHLKASGLEEGVSTRLLIYAGELIRQGIAPRRASTVAVTWSLTDENESKRAIDEIVKAIFP